MEGRMAMLLFIAAVAGVHTLACLPGDAVRLLLACVCLAAGLLRWRFAAAPAAAACARSADVAIPYRRDPKSRGHHRLRTLALCIGIACGGAFYAIERAQHRLDDALPADQQNQVARATWRVVSLAEYAADAVRFDAEVIQAEPAGTPRHVRVSWPLPMRGSDAAQRSVMPGQQWRGALVMRRPHAASNPYAADGEARLFQRNVRALATVRGRPRLMEDEGWRFGMASVHRARHMLRARMHELLDGTRYGAVIVALALGDQAGVMREDWQVFNATGITHLVSISGLHVTLVAGLAGTAVAWCWRRSRWRGLYLAERMPAQLAGIAAALCIAWLYCLLAGWGIPARRTFFMLAVACGAALLRVPVSHGAMLLAAACVVVVLDPWAPIAPGFWLSFGAVAAVLSWGRATGGTAVAAARDDSDAGRASGWPQGWMTPGYWRAWLRRRFEPGYWRAWLRRWLEAGHWRNWLRGVAQAGRLQCVVTLSLIPVLAFLTQQVALASPLANAVAIPVVSLLATPLALLCAALCAIPGAQPAAALAGHAAEWIFGLTMRWIEWLAGQGWAVWNVAAPPTVLLALAIGGIAWALLPPGMATRRWAWLLLLPALCWRPARPAEGEWRLTALDVGQGGAVVVETARHTLVFDAGPLHRNGTDGAQRVVWPYLRARGIKRIDTLVVSHGDQDHAGGLDSLVRAVPVHDAYAPFDLPARLHRDARMRGHGLPVSLPALSHRCEAGQEWETDGVRFAFLHPFHSAGRRRSDGGSNAAGCVLLVQGHHHTALLPGDVGIAQERKFADALPRIDVLMAPHHGSATSSGDALVMASRADHVIAQVGYLNRFRHPASSVERRWRRAGAVFWRTDHHGAVIASSGAGGLEVYGQRDWARRYWHAGM